MENRKLPKPTEADYKKREEIISKYGEMSDEHIDILNAFDWSTHTFEQDGKYGLKNALGKVLIAPHFEDFMLLTLAELKTGERVVAKLNGQWGVLQIDGKGKWIIEPEFEYIGYPNAITHIKRDGKWGVINLETKEYLVRPECDSISDYEGFLFVDGIAYFEKNGKTGVINYEGKYTEPIFEDIDLEPEEFVKVKYNGKWGYIDEKGKFTEKEDDAYFLNDM